MEVSIRFGGGPLDGQTALTDGLSDARVFFDQRQRLVHLYLRVDELAYGYAADQSKALTKDYDHTLSFFSTKDADSLRFFYAEDDDAKDQ